MIRSLSLAGMALAVAAACGWATTAQAAGAYPDRPIRLIVPYSAGGGADNAARVIAQKLSERLGQSVIVENKPGASGTVAEGYVVRSPADGYTVLYDTFAFGVNASLRKLPFDPRHDLEPVSLVATAAMILVENPKLPSKTLGQLLAAAKAHPGTITYASYGVGSSAHLAAELLNDRAGTRMLHVPFKGGAPALTNVIGGQVDCYFANVSSGLPYVRSGMVRALAVSSATRLKVLPKVPTVQESGFPGFEVLDWHGLFVPRGTPGAIVEKLAKAANYATSDPSVIKRLHDMGIEPASSSPAKFGKFLDGQMKKWSTLIEQRHISLQ